MFTKMKMGTKMIAAFCVVIIITGIIGLVGYLGMNNIFKNMDEIAEVRMPGVESLLSIKESQLEVLLCERGLINHKMMEPEVRKSQYSYIDNALKTLDDARKTYELLPKTKEEAEQWKKFVSEYELWHKDSQKVIGLSLEKDKLITSGFNLTDPKILALDDEVFEASLQSRKSFLAALETLNSLVDMNKEIATEQSTKANNVATLSNKLLVGVLITGMVTALLLGIFFARSITRIINELLGETEKLVNSAVSGQLNNRGNVEKINFEFNGIILGINKLLDALVGYINVMPVPVMVIDKDFNIRYLNQVGADLVGLSTEQVLGTKCYEHFKTSDCHTSNCACTMAMQQGRSITRETDAHPRGMNMDISYTGIPIKDSSGKNVASMEFIIDQTAIRLATRVMQKQAAYQENEVNKLVVNLGNLAKGELNINTNVAPTDEDTRLIGENFAKINNSLENSVKAINSLVTDANKLASAAMEGKLSTRAEVAKHSGEFAKIVEGFNKTLDAVLHPINEAAACLQEIAKGNLDVEMVGAYKGDHTIIKDNLNATLNAFNKILSQVAVAVDHVASGAQQVSDSSQALSHGSTESASSLEEITSSMHQITAQTNQNADNATQANLLATQARVNAEKGNEQMQQMVKAMRDINDAATNISKIIKAIDEIAFQTNLLALNAAVEAARAGKHGKGFTVVAEEVRNLAQRSAKAAKETAEMIEGSIKKTEVGTGIAVETSTALEEIVQGATKVTDLIGEIASASKEQAMAIGQINQGLSQVDQVVQQNTASAEESAAASEELSGQSIQLKQMLNKFKLRRGDLGNLTMAGNAYPVFQQRKQTQSWTNNKVRNKNDEIIPEEIISLDDSNFDKF